ncbi:MAG: TlpA disulfide reductase family protein [Acidimicrobiales bacterium]
MRTDLDDISLEERPATSADSRRSSLLLGTVAAVAALAAAVVAAIVASGMQDGEPAVGRPEPEAEIRFLPEDDESDRPLIAADRAGDPAPDASFPMLDGGLATFADFRGKPVVVNFFASWCEPCLAEMPDFAQVHAELGGEVTFLGMSLRDSEDDARAILEETGVEYLVGRDPSGSLAEAFGVVNMPSTYFLDAEGRIVSAHAGVLTADELRSQLAALR